MKKTDTKDLMLKDKLQKGVKNILITTVVALFITAGIALQLSYNTAIKEKQQGFDIEIETAVDNLISTLSVNYSRFENGEITEEEALTTAKLTVRNSRYNNGDGYFWADMADGLCAIHMNPEYEGAKRYEVIDKKGNYYIQNLIKAGDTGKPYTEYYFTKPEKKGVFKKRAYTAKFEPYGWYISTGNYYDDINKEVLKLRGQQAVSDALLILISIVFVIIGTRKTGNVIATIIQPLTLVTKRLHQLSEGDVHSSGTANITTKDETGILAAAENSLITQIHSIVDDITENLSKISFGDLRVQTAGNYQGDFMPIEKSINDITTFLNTALLSINHASSQVKSGSIQVSEMSKILAEGASDQAGVIEELSASLDEISTHVEKNTASVDKATDYIEQIIDKANEGNTRMQSLLTAMENIEHASGKISSINKAVGALAARTNLLALNASIESARLGAEGKGFAVVAEEMRLLASQSAEAVNETEKLINTSIEAVGEGSKTTLATASSLNDINSMFDRFKEIMNEIDSQSRRQNGEVKQIALGISQISAIVQNNVAVSEECSAFSEDLNTNATLLFENVDKFIVVS